MSRESTASITRCLLLAVAPVILAGCTPAPSPAPQASRQTAPASFTTTAGDAEAAEMVSLRVPTMHCPFSCWPAVKETLEKQEGVAEVTLAKQVKEDEIDNPVVHIRIAGNFDSAKAVEALATAGFDDAAVQ